MYRTDGCPFDPEHLAIHNGLLAPAGSVLKDRFGKVRVETNQIWNTASVIAMPMCKEHL